MTDQAALDLFLSLSSLLDAYFSLFAFLLFLSFLSLLSVGYLAYWITELRHEMLAGREIDTGYSNTPYQSHDGTK